MEGADLLKASTGTAVAQLSEAGLGILGAKKSKGMWVCSAAVVLAILSSRMSAVSCSLAGRRDNVPCLAITAITMQRHDSQERMEVGSSQGSIVTAISSGATDTFDGRSTSAYKR